MILPALVGFSLLAVVSADPSFEPPGGANPRPPAALSAQQKTARLRPLVRSATECVVRTISADPRFGQSAAAGDINALIVDSMTSCADVMRAMIDAHDRLFGFGTGEAFFMGPYLDGLPSVVDKLVKGVER